MAMKVLEMMTRSIFSDEFMSNGEVVYYSEHGYTRGTGVGFFGGE